MSPYRESGTERQILVLMGGDAYAPRLVAVFPMSDVDRAAAFWQPLEGDMYTPHGEIWDGDRKLGTIWSSEDLLNGVVSWEKDVRENGRKSRRRSRRSSRRAR